MDPSSSTNMTQIGRQMGHWGSSFGHDAGPDPSFAAMSELVLSLDWKYPQVEEAPCIS